MHPIDKLHDENPSGGGEECPRHIYIFEVVLFQKIGCPLHIGSLSSEIEFDSYIFLETLHQPLIVELIEHPLRHLHELPHHRKVAFHLRLQLPVLNFNSHFLPVQQSSFVHLGYRSRRN